MHYYVYYSRTSDKGPSEIGTMFLQRTLVSTPCYYFSVLFDLQDRDDLHTRDKIIGPIVSLVWMFHCMNKEIETTGPL